MLVFLVLGPAIVTVINIYLLIFKDIYYYLLGSGKHT
jgi:hypothetical protein